MPGEYVEFPVDERKIPRFARRMLKRARHDGRTGLLAYALIPGGSSPPPWNWRLVFVREGDRAVFSAGPGLRSPAPGISAPAAESLVPRSGRPVSIVD